MTIRTLTRLANLVLLIGTLILIAVAGATVAQAHAAPAAPITGAAVDTMPQPPMPPTPTAIPATATGVRVSAATATATPPPTSTPSPTPELPALSRIVIPAIDLDRTIVPMGWHIEEDSLGPVQVWDVPNGAAGHHEGSANPGDGGNIVVSGHVGGSDPIFPRLIELTEGDTVQLYRGETAFTYRITAIHRLQEVGAPIADQRANAEFIAPTDHERVTLITCWPPSGPNAFDQRLIVQAEPLETP